MALASRRYSPPALTCGPERVGFDKAYPTGDALLKVQRVRVRSRRCRLGSVAQVVDKFRPLEPPWYTDIIVRHITDNQAKIVGSLARLAEVGKALRKP